MLEHAAGASNDWGLTGLRPRGAGQTDAGTQRDSLINVDARDLASSAAGVVSSMAMPQRYGPPRGSGAAPPDTVFPRGSHRMPMPRRRSRREVPGEEGLGFGLRFCEEDRRGHGDAR